MSYDLEIWSVHPFRPDTLTDPSCWEIGSQCCSYGEKAWQIVIYMSTKVLPEDLPKAVAPMLPGIRFLTHLHLEGGSSEKSFRLLQSTATDIARHAHGVVVDQQESSACLPAGVKHFVAPNSSSPFDAVALSWWFLESPLLTPAGRERLVALMERILPDALPRRYGAGEPPANVFAEKGKAHFLDFLDKNLRAHVVWYPHRPVVSVHFSTPQPMGAHKLGFRTNYLKIEIEKEALYQPGWAENARRFWEEASILVQPIYGEVRITGKYRWHGASVVIAKGEFRPQPGASWWWKGLPRNLGNAVVLGPVYQKLWPAFTAVATRIGELAFASEADWSIDGNLTRIVGEPPADQMAGEGAPAPAKEAIVLPRRTRQYPSGWPFGAPFLP